MNMKKILLASVCLAVGAHATPSATGFFAEINLGGAYDSIKEYFRADGQEKKDQKEIVKEHKNAFFVGGSLGYGYEMACGFYVGAKVYGLYDAAEIKEDKNNKDLNVTVKLSEADVALSGGYTLKAKPMFSYGASIMLGGKVMPNLLAYASFGVEGTYTKIEQSIYLVNADYTNGVFINNNNTKTYIKENKGTVTPGNHDEIKTTTLSFVPGIGAKYFLTSGMYFGFDAGVSIGLNKELDQKYFNKGSSFKASTEASTEVTLLSLKDQKSALYLKRDLGVRYGVSIGYKF